MVCLGTLAALLVAPVAVMALAWRFRDREEFASQMDAELREWRGLIRKPTRGPRSEPLTCVLVYHLKP
jgi:hypothetical protein